jgi:hypothetical protein
LPLALALAVWLGPASAQDISHVAPAAKRSVGDAPVPTIMTVTVNFQLR